MPVSRTELACGGLLLAILGLGAYLRLSNLDIVPFHEDSARSLALARWHLETRTLPAAAAMSSVGLLFPPLEVYVNMAALTISLDPAFITGIYAALNVIALSLAYFFVRRYFGRWEALISTALFATGFWAVSFSRGIWNVSLSPPLTVLFMFSVFSFALAKRPASLAWAFLWLSLLAQTHFSALPHIIFFAVVVLLYRSQVKMKYLLTGFGLFLLPLLPYLYWEVANDFYNLRALGNLGAGPQASFDVTSWRYAVFMMASQGFNATFGPPEPNLLAEPLALIWLRRLYEVAFYLSLAFLAINLLSTWKERCGSRWRGYLLLLLWLAIPVAFFFWHRWPLYIHYSIPLYPVQFAIVAVGTVGAWRLLARWTKTWKQGKLLASSSGALLAIFFTALVAGQAFASLRFNRWISEETVTPIYGLPLKHMDQAIAEARRMSAANGGAPIYVGFREDKYTQGVFAYLSDDANPFRFFDESQSLPVSSSRDLPSIYLLTSMKTQAADFIERSFPNVERRLVPYPGNADALAVYVVPSNSAEIVSRLIREGEPLPLRWPNGMELLAYKMGAKAEAPGKLPLTLYWKITDTSARQLRTDYRFFINPLPNKDYRLFTHLLDGTLNRVTGIDAMEVPVAYWQQGDVIVTWRDMDLPPDTESGPYWLSVGMYEYGPNTRVPLLDMRSGQNADSLRLGPIMVAGKPLSPAHSLYERLDGDIELLGFDIERGKPKDGMLRVDLYWKALQSVETSYKVFVHVMDNEGGLVAQHDGDPLGGLYPLPVWQREEEVKDIHEIALPADATAGLQLVVGMYHPETGERLRTADGRDSINLGQLP